MTLRIRNAPNFFIRVIRRIYCATIRNFLPVSGPVVYSTVTTDIDRHIGDRFVPGLVDQFSDIVDYEAALIRALKLYVQPGMTIVIVGGGIGITSVIAARLAGVTGKVICFEGSRRNIARIKLVAERNGVSDQINVHHAIVGPPIVVYHDDLSAERIAPSAIPECDLLELDCEGSEKAILSEMSERPTYVLVETHGVYRSPTVDVASILKSKGYSIDDFGVAEPRLRKICEVNDIRVLAAQLLQ